MHAREQDVSVMDVCITGDNVGYYKKSIDQMNAYGLPHLLHHFVRIKIASIANALVFATFSIRRRYLNKMTMNENNV